jgi:glycosyltransferase involved in cell wall biosynthesis
VDYVRAPGLARNSALSQMNSKYVMFVDSDDYIYLEEINKLINLPQQPTVIIASYEKVNLKTKEVSFFRCPTSTAELAVEPALWRFIFKTSEIRNIQFTKFRMAEDQIFLAEYFSTTKQVYSTGNVVYRYSVSGDGQISKSPEALKELRKALDYLETEPKLIQTEFGSLIYARLSLSIRLHALQKILTNISFSKKVVQILHTFFCKEYVGDPDPSFSLVWFVNG